MRNHITLGLALLLTACATAPKTPVAPPVLIEAEPEAPKVVERIVPVPYAQPMPGNARYKEAGPSAEDIAKARKALKEKGEAAVVEDAKNRARQTLDVPEGYMNAARVYPYMEHTPYSVISAVHHTTLVTWGKGEYPINRYIGDTLAWDVDEMKSGAGKQERWHTVIQPRQSGMHTTLTITTNWGVYMFELRSVQHKGHLAAVSFRHPTRKLYQHTRPNAVAKKGAKASTPTDMTLAVSLDQIETRYHLVRYGAKPRWAPTRVFHDGKRTFIEFPEGSARPALFVLKQDRSPEIVQYAVKGRYYVVPRVIERAELKLGEGARLGLELTKEARR